MANDLTPACRHTNLELTPQVAKKRCSQATSGYLIVPLFRCTSCGLVATAADFLMRTSRGMSEETT